MTNLYQEQILDRSKNPRFCGSLENATHHAEGANLSCGDEISWHANLENGRITELRHTGRACAICTASADMLAEKFQGEPIADVHNLKTEDITDMLGIPLSPIRLKCALLPLETLKQLTDN